jgi:hypothetical protein
MSSRRSVPEDAVSRLAGALEVGTIILVGSEKTRAAVMETTGTHVYAMRLDIESPPLPLLSGRRLRGGWWVVIPWDDVVIAT